MAPPKHTGRHAPLARAARNVHTDRLRAKAAKAAIDRKRLQRQLAKLKASSQPPRITSNAISDVAEPQSVALGTNDEATSYSKANNTSNSTKKQTKSSSNDEKNESQKSKNTKNMQKRPAGRYEHILAWQREQQQAAALARSEAAEAKKAADRARIEAAARRAATAERLRTRTKRGQPVLANVVDVLVDRLRAPSNSS